jgi:hypothetical protein
MVHQSTRGREGNSGEAREEDAAKVYGYTAMLRANSEVDLGERRAAGPCPTGWASFGDVATPRLEPPVSTVIVQVGQCRLTLSNPR